MTIADRYRSYGNQANIAPNFFLNSHWAVADTWFKRNNDMSAIAADRPRHTFPLKIVLVGTVVTVGKVELDDD